MNYEIVTGTYNERRYGKPWRAIVNEHLTKDFTFLDWEGHPGQAGLFDFEAVPGTIIAYGQKDLRKGRGGIDGYELTMPCGKLLSLDGDQMAYKKLEPEARWRKLARARLDHWMAVQPTRADWRGPEPNPDFGKRGALVAKYSAMLGVEDPLMRQAAEFFGLIDSQPAPTPITMEAFGL